MTLPADLEQLMTQAHAEFLCYGPPPEEGGVRMAEHFGAYEAEYAAIRRHVGIHHRPQVGLLKLRGSDVKDFLHRMVTQDINGQTGGASVRALQVNTKGRVVADLTIHHGDESTWAECDVFDLPEVQKMWDAALFAEDVSIQDITEQRVAVSLHGPAALALLQKVSEDADAAQTMANMPGTHHVLSLLGKPVTVSRRDTCGVMGLHLYIPNDHATVLYAALLEHAGFALDAPSPEDDPDAAAEHAAKRRQSLRGRPVGWLAFNTARIEAGHAIFHIDFGPDSLPAEAGDTVMDESVSFTKGCYLGQEIVARMKNLGHPKRVLTGLKLPEGQLAVAGSQCFAAPKDEDQAPDLGKIIGGVTSSTVSPLLGHTPIAFAVLKWGKHRPGNDVLVSVEGELVRAEVVAPSFV